MEAAPESERSDAFSLPSGNISDEARQNRIANVRLNGGNEDHLSGSQNSAIKALENLDINLNEINNLNNAADAPSELLISQIHGEGHNSSKKE